MRMRRRSNGAHPGGEPQVLSTPPSAFATRPPPRKKQSVKSEVVDMVKRIPLGGHPSTGDVLNAYWNKNDLTLVIPDDTKPNGIRFQRIIAEHSLFLKREDIQKPTEFVRKLNHHSAVRKAIWEDDWLRISCNSRDTVKIACRGYSEIQDHRDYVIPTYEGMVSPVLRHMVDNDLQPATPRQVWVDLETDSRVPFSRAIEGAARILSWATEDAHGNRVHAMLEEDTDEAECKLLLALWEVFENYDQILAWGGERFDFPIIKHRSILHKLLRGADREWRRWLWLDHLALYRRMNMAAAESGDEKTSMALQAVSMALLGTGKDDFDSSKTWEAWFAGGAERERLMKYNIQDTALMPRIEAKTGYVMLLQTVADTCGTFADSRGSNPGVQVEGFLARLAHSKGYKFPTVFPSLKARDPYAGAYVLHPEKNAGVHHDVHVADFATQYPSIIISFNISPETIVEEPDGLPCVECPLTGHFFRTDVVGILPEAVQRMIELRKFWNDKKSAATPGTDEWKDADRRSAAYKITANSFYGVIGAPTSRHYDRRVAESITQVAKWEILETIQAAENAELRCQLPNMKVIYADTDSLFVEGATRDDFESFVRWCNEELYPRITRQQGCAVNRIKLAYEKQFKRLIFTTAKRYVGNYVHYKGTDADEFSKPEIKGLEFKRGDSLRITRRFQEEIVYRLVSYNTNVDPDDIAGFEQVCARWLDCVMEDRFDVDDIVVSKTLNKPLKDYLVANPMVRIAREMEARGEDVAEGAKIRYVIIDAAVSPQVVRQAHEYDPDSDDIDRMALWDKQIWPPTERLLEAAFPDHTWERFAGLVRARKAIEKAEAKQLKVAQKAAEKAAKAAAKAAAKIKC